jgi:hypothetical protein
MLCKSNFQPEPIDNCEQIHIVTRLRTRKAKEEVLKWLKTEDPTLAELSINPKELWPKPEGIAKFHSQMAT